MLIHRYQIFARFGLMHMIATNLCVWLRVVISETVREVQGNPSAGKGQQVNNSQSASTSASLSGAYDSNKLRNSVRTNFDELKFMYREDSSSEMDAVSVTTGILFTMVSCLHLLLILRMLYLYL